MSLGGLLGRTASGAYLVVLLYLVLTRSADAVDALAFWSVDATPYDTRAGLLGSFLYPPPAAVVASWFGAMPLDLFVRLVTLVNGLALLWIAGPWAILLILLEPVRVELGVGNIQILLAAAIALSLRYPAAWAFVLLTKPTYGVGLLWYVVRGEWRRLAVALGVTAAIALPTLLLPDLWTEWFGTLQAGSRWGTEGVWGVPLWVRLPVAAVIVWYAARRDIPWLMPLGAGLAMPIAWYTSPLVGLLGAIAVERHPPQPLMPHSKSSPMPVSPSSQTYSRRAS